MIEYREAKYNAVRWLNTMDSLTTLYTFSTEYGIKFFAQDMIKVSRRANKTSIYYKDIIQWEYVSFDLLKMLILLLDMC